MNKWQTTLPSHIGLPDLATVQDDNDHGTGWRLIESADQGPYANILDRYYARYESEQGYWADYFYVGGYWSLGAN